MRETPGCERAGYFPGVKEAAVHCDIIMAACCSGTLTQDGVARPVQVQVVLVHKDSAKAEHAWRQLVLHQQLSEVLGNEVVRVVGYVEHPGRSLQLIFEDTAGSALDLMNCGQMSVQEAVRFWNLDVSRA